MGQKLRRAIAGSGKKISLELGGKSPFVVFDSADLDSTVEGVVDAIFFNQGQVLCLSLSSQFAALRSSVYSYFRSPFFHSVVSGMQCRVQTAGSGECVRESGQEDKGENDSPPTGRLSGQGLYSNMLVYFWTKIIFFPQGIDMGAIVDPSQRKSIDEYVQEARRDGADVYQACATIPSTGCYYPPTLITGVQPVSRCVQEEVRLPLVFLSNVCLL